MRNRKNLQYGFTLIELLVVISIIGFLASIILINVNNARTKARDTRRVANKNQVAKALQAYNISYGTWPGVTDQWYCLAPSTEGKCYGNFFDPITAPMQTQLSEFITVFPRYEVPVGSYWYDRHLYKYG